MKNVKGAKGLIIVLVLVLMVVGYFYYLSNRDYADRHEEDVVITPVKDLLLKDFGKNYPPTPKEVVKQYLEFTKVLHNEELSDEDVEALGLKLEELFDDELKNAKSDEEYIKDLKSELTTFKDNDYSIVNMYTSSSTDVEEFSMDGYEVARLYGTFNVRTKDGTKILQEVFILRKEQSTGHWKIYGFAPVTDDESAE